MNEKMGDGPDRSQEILEAMKAIEEDRFSLCGKNFDTTELRDIHAEKCPDCTQGAWNLIGHALGGSKDKPQG